jgi:hypothetical protein
MKLLLSMHARRYLIVGGVLFFAACSGGQPLPNAQTPTQSVTAIGMASGPMLPATCTDPKEIKVCLEAGTSAKLPIRLICKKNSGKVSCGKVTWTTKMSNKELTAKFSPNPGNPTTETITASKSIEVGHYTQAIVAKCTFVPECVDHLMGDVWIVK